MFNAFGQFVYNGSQSTQNVRRRSISFERLYDNFYQRDSLFCEPCYIVMVRNISRAYSQIMHIKKIAQMGLKLACMGNYVYFFNFALCIHFLSDC